MPAKTITTSSNIASLDSNINIDLCAGIFYIDSSPTIYIGSGIENVLGANVRITNPYNNIIRDYPDTGYDINPPLMEEVVSFYVPTQAANYVYGQYTFDLKMTDANGDEYTVTKSVSICAPDVNNKTQKYGTLSAQLNGSCKDGKLYIVTDTVPAYNGVISDSQSNDFSLQYPTSSTIPNIDSTTQGVFSTYLFEGQYKWNGIICANYSYGDNVSVKVRFNVKREKIIKCLLDESCIGARLVELDAKVHSDCTDAEKIETLNITVNTLRLVKTIEIRSNDGDDVSDLIDQLEDLLGCTCTCNCADGTPIINNAPSKDFSITGCGFNKTSVGLTDIYTFDNGGLYKVEVVPNGGVLTVTTPTLIGCEYKQVFTFSISAMYTKLKGLIVNTTEWDYWASIINKSWDSLDTTCLESPSGWLGLTYAERTQLIFNQLCNGGSCNAEISTNSVSSSASDVVASWTNVSGVFEIAAYIDDVFAGTTLYPETTFKFIGAADGSMHSYKLYSKCTNGSLGNLLEGEFTYYGCPYLAMPTVSMTSITGATCPYDLTTLVSGLPMGVSQEWHTLNNTSLSTLVSDPAHAIGGSYYVFAKNSDGCYSQGVNVVLSCSAATNCSAPQTLIVDAITGGNRVRFQSAAYPPPSNSYTVKRRLKSDPDISGSYTTIGTPTFNATVSRWEILDAAPTDNTLYTYRAISNCTSSAPYIDYDFANINCPVVTLTPSDSSIDYSFTNSGGSIDKYEVRIYSSDGITLIHTDTRVPAFSSPITGTFIYLDGGTTYQVRPRVFIGTYYKDCGSTSATTQYNYTLSGSYGLSIDSVTGTGVPTLVPTGTSGNQHGHQTGMSGSYDITVSGTVYTTTKLDAYVNGVVVDCIAVTVAGTYSLSITALETDIVLIAVDSGSC